MRICCWKIWNRFVSAVDAAGRAAGDQPPAALQRQQAAGPGIGPDMFEDHVDAFLAGLAPGPALEAVLAVVQHRIGAQRQDARDLLVAAHGRQHPRAGRLGHQHRGAADAAGARHASGSSRPPASRALS